MTEMALARDAKAGCATARLAAAEPTPALNCVIVGDNPVKLWGLTPRQRFRRIMAAHHFIEQADIDAKGPALLVNAGFVFDPAWLRHYATNPGAMLTLGGVPVLAACRDRAERIAIADAMHQGATVEYPPGVTVDRVEDGVTMANSQLRKREQPFVLPLTAQTMREAERASYFGAYKGVTDLLTKYLWPEWALTLTRVAARFGITPNMVTAVGAIFCVLATLLFWGGHYWAGIATGLVFMVLDTVDGKLARCTITSSRWGNIFDHGLDLVHPPFWWYTWGIGLTAYGRPLAPDLFEAAMAAIIGGYVVQRMIEGAFMRIYGMHIHVWRPIDSRFRLVTARRNPNMVILFASMLIDRPELGLLAIALWTILSCVFHFVRLIQAMTAHRAGFSVQSWLEQAQ